MKTAALFWRVKNKKEGLKVNYESIEIIDLERVNFDESIRLGKEINAIPRECYHNAIKGLAAIDAGLYVEGYLLFKDLPIPIEHGWLTSGGMVIDPTLAILPVKGVAAYVPAYEFSGNDIIDHAIGGRPLPIFMHYECTPKYEAMVCAHDVAMAQIYGAEYLETLADLRRNSSLTADNLP